MSAHNPNRPATSWVASFDADPLDPAPFLETYQDLTNRVVAHTSSCGRQYEIGAVEAGVANLTCRNDDEALSPANPNSPYNSGFNQLIPYRQIQRTEIMVGAAGNWINDTNALLLATPLKASDGTFEDGTIGHWIPGGAAAQPTLTNDATHVKSGTKALKLAFASTPGTLAGGYLLAPGFAGVQVTVSCQVYLTALLTSSAWVAAGIGVGASVSTLGAFQKATITFTPTTNGPVYVSICFVGTGAGNAWVDEVQLEYGPTANTFTSTGPMINPQFTGYIERYPVRWDHQGFYGWNDLVAVDALALLAKYSHKDVLTEDVTLDFPGASYPMLESGGTSAGNNSAQPQPALTVNQVGTGGTLALGNTSLPGPGVDALPCLSCVPPAGVNGKFLAGTIPNSLGGFGGFAASVECWFQTSQAIAMGIASALGNWFVPANAALMLYIQTDGTMRATNTQDGGGTFPYTLASTAKYNDGVWHHAVVTEVWSGGNVTATLYVDAVQIATSTVALSSAFYPAGTMVGYVPYQPGISTWNGQLARAAFYAYALTPARITSHYLAGTTGFSGETTGARITRLLGWAGWIGSTAIDTGASLMQGAAGLSGLNARDALQQCADTELGLVFASAAGQITFYGRDHYYLQTSAVAVFGENTDAGEIPYTGDIGFDTDPQYIANEITVSRPAGPDQYLEDTASKRSFSHSPLAYTTYTNNDADSLGLAQRLLNTRKDARQRVTALAVDAASNPAAFATVLVLKLGDRVTVNRRTVAGTVSADYFIERIDRDVGPDKYIVRYQMSPVAPYQAWIIGDNAFGVVGATSVAVH